MEIRGLPDGIGFFTYCIALFTNSLSFLPILMLSVFLCIGYYSVNERRIR